ADLDNGVGGEEGVGGLHDLSAGQRAGEGIGEPSDDVAPEERRRVLGEPARGGEGSLGGVHFGRRGAADFGVAEAGGDLGCAEADRFCLGPPAGVEVFGAGRHFFGPAGGEGGELAGGGGGAAVAGDLLADLLGPFGEVLDDGAGHAVGIGERL